MQDFLHIRHSILHKNYTDCNHSGPDVRLRDDIPLQNAYEIASPVVWMVHDDDHVRSRSRLHDHARDHDARGAHGDARGHIRSRLHGHVRGHDAHGDALLFCAYREFFLQPQHLVP